MQARLFELISTQKQQWEHQKKSIEAKVPLENTKKMAAKLQRDEKGTILKAQCKVVAPLLQPTAGQRQIQHNKLSKGRPMDSLAGSFKPVYWCDGRCSKNPSHPWKKK